MKKLALHGHFQHWVFHLSQKKKFSLSMSVLFKIDNWAWLCLVTLQLKATSGSKYILVSHRQMRKYSVGRQVCAVGTPHFHKTELFPSIYFSFLVPGLEKAGSCQTPTSQLFKQIKSTAKVMKIKIFWANQRGKKKLSHFLNCSFRKISLWMVLFLTCSFTQTSQPSLQSLSVSLHKD